MVMNFFIGLMSHPVYFFLVSMLKNFLSWCWKKWARVFVSLYLITKLFSLKNCKTYR